MEKRIGQYIRDLSINETEEYECTVTDHGDDLLKKEIKDKI
jgi:hypothetical protein